MGNRQQRAWGIDRREAGAATEGSCSADRRGERLPPHNRQDADRPAQPKRPPQLKMALEQNQWKAGAGARQHTGQAVNSGL